MGEIVGRKVETQVIQRELVPGRLVALVGPSGMGKTTLARSCQMERTGRFVECRNLTPADVARELAGLSEATEDEAWFVAAEALAELDVIVFDDIGREFGALDTFRAHWPGAVLTTSQHVVEGKNVSIVPLEAFDVPSLERIKESDAFALFMKTARSVDARFDVDADDIAAIHTIAVRFGGYPLGLALAARRAATVTPRGVLEYLGETDALSDRSRPERHQTVDRAISMSWQSLSTAQMARMYAMSLFQRPVGVDVIAELVAEPLAETLGGIEVLVQEAFVSRARFPVPRELFAHHAVANYAGEGNQSAHAIRTRAMDLAVALAQELPPGFSDDSVFGEGPSLWQWAVTQTELDALEAEEIDALLAAYARWARFTTPSGVDGFAEYLAVLEEKGGSNAWLQRARVGDLGWESAVEAFERSFSLADDAEQRLHTLVAASDVMSALGNFELARAYYVRAEDEGIDHPMLDFVRAKLSPDRRDTALYQRLSEQIESLDQVDLNYLTLCLKAMSFAPVERAPEAGERAIAVARELRSRIWLAKTQLVYVECLGVCGVEFEKSFEYMEEAAQVLTDIDPDRLDQAAPLRAAMYLGAGRAGEAGDLLKDVIARQARPSPTTYRLLRLAEWVDPNCEASTTNVPDAPYITRFATNAYALARFGQLFEAGQADTSSEIIRSSEERLVPFLETLKALIELQGGHEITPEVIQLRIDLRKLLEPPRGSEIGAIALAGFLAARDLPALHRMKLLEACENEVVIASDYSAVRVSGEWVAIASDTSRRLLQALVESEDPLDYDPLAELLYPDETLSWDALQNRVSVAVSRLRRVGLKPYVVKAPDGFVLKGDIRVEG